MSGYTGNPDAESEHALIVSENGIAAARALLQGSIKKYCDDCGDPIDPARIAAAKSMNMKCHYCIKCQGDHDKAPKVRMLDRIL